MARNGERGTREFRLDAQLRADVPMRPRILQCFANYGRWMEAAAVSRRRRRRCAELRVDPESFVSLDAGSVLVYRVSRLAARVQSVVVILLREDPIRDDCPTCSRTKSFRGDIVADTG
jgi:hypothetical protein